MRAENIISASQRTQRFPAFLISLGVITAQGVLALVLAKEISEGLVVAVMSPIVMLATGYLGFGAWHDKNTRIAAIKADPTSQPQPPQVMIEKPLKAETNLVERKEEP